MNISSEEKGVIASFDGKRIINTFSEIYLLIFSHM